MKRLLALVSAVAFSLLPVTRAQQKSSTDEVVRAADRFLGTLTAEQRQKVMVAFDDATQRVKWSNFPTGFVPRSGISLKQMSAQQQEAAMKLLGSVLSPMGLEKVNEIRQADDDFKANGSKRGPGGGQRPSGPPPGGQGGPPPQPVGHGPGGPGGPGGRPSGGGEMFGGDLYFISFLGTPSTKQPWMLQFGGHHLALNITIAGASVERRHDC